MVCTMEELQALEGSRGDGNETWGCRLGLRVEGLGIRVLGLEFEVEDSRFRVWFRFRG